MGQKSSEEQVKLEQRIGIVAPMKRHKEGIGNYDPMQVFRKSTHQQRSAGTRVASGLSLTVAGRVLPHSRQLLRSADDPPNHIYTRCDAVYIGAVKGRTLALPLTREQHDTASGLRFTGKAWAEGTDRFCSICG